MGKKEGGVVGERIIGFEIAQLGKIEVPVTPLQWRTPVARLLAGTSVVSARL